MTISISAFKQLISNVIYQPIKEIVSRIKEVADISGNKEIVSRILEVADTIKISVVLCYI